MRRLWTRRRRSDLVLAVGLVLISASFFSLLRILGAENGSSREGGAVLAIGDASLWIVIASHLLVSGGLIWLYLRWLKPADDAADLLSSALFGRGDPIPRGWNAMTAAREAKDRLDRSAGEMAEVSGNAQRLQDRRFAELAEAHQDLITHHRCTKKMLRAQQVGDVCETLLKGIREGLGFHGAAMGVLDRDRYLVFQDDAPPAGSPMIRIPAWDENSLLSRTLWAGNPAMIPSLQEQIHVPEDRRVLGEGPAFMLPVTRKQNARCSQVKNCNNIGCSAYLTENPRCWIEHHLHCRAHNAILREERRKECVLCEMFAPLALLAVRSVPDSRKISRESVAPAITLANEASLALEVVELYENIRRMSVTDGLTGLANHREFYQQLRRELERARRYRHTVSLLIIDVDDFKKFNDRFGHLAGDLALKKIAELLRQCARMSDLVARYGGEEFAVILPESTPSGALMLAERIKTEIAQHDFMPDPPDGVRLTVSIGIYSSEEGAASEDQMVSFADEAAYSAKNAGKNRVVVKAHA